MPNFDTLFSNLGVIFECTRDRYQHIGQRVNVLFFFLISNNFQTRSPVVRGR